MTITRAEAIASVTNNLTITTSSGQKYAIEGALSEDSSVAAPYVIEFQYAGTSQPGDLNSQFSGWTEFTAAEKARYEEMLEYIESIANVDFQLVSGQSDPTMNVGKVSLPTGVAGVGGFGYGISINGSGTVSMTDYDNFTVFDDSISLASGSDNLILHEVMHALSFEHTFSGSGTVSGEYDSNKYSILSYTANPENGEDSDGLQLFDILALQERWGANEATAAGDDVYTGKRNTTVDTIWDASGTDTFDASSRTSDVILSLLDTTFSSFDSLNDVAIAYDVVIENAIGGSGNDAITGNAVVNVLRGGDGDDTIDGGAGNDFLTGGADADALDGGAGVDRAVYTDATSWVLADLAFSNLNVGFAAGDTYTSIEDFSGSAFSDSLRGDAANNQIWGYGGQDMIYGRDGDDMLAGMNGNDKLYGQDGDDSLFGGNGADVLLGGIGTDLLGGGNGADVLGGGQGDDQLYGAAGADALYGALGNDLLNGGAGADTLLGSTGADTLTGGTEADVFQFNATSDSTGSDSDTITDFEFGDFINLATIDANTVSAGNQAFSFVGSTLFSGTAGELRFEVDGSNGVVSGDVDGDGNQDFNISLLGITALAVDSFIL